MKPPVEPTMGYTGRTEREEDAAVAAKVPRAERLREVGRAFYQLARASVFAAGFGDELRWQADVNLDDLTAATFLCEHAFVVCNSGMRSAVIDKLWPRLREVFHGFQDRQLILATRTGHRTAALRVLNSPPKIDAILKMVALVEDTTWPILHQAIHDGGVQQLRQFPYMGPVIVWHLAKNIGLQVAKPDRHLVRIAQALEYGTPGTDGGRVVGNDDVQTLCAELAEASGDSIPVVDLVMWRYASTLNPAYLEQLRLPRRR